MLSTSTPDSRDPSLAELVQYSSKVASQKAARRSPEIARPRHGGDRDHPPEQEPVTAKKAAAESFPHQETAPSADWFQTASELLTQPSYAAPLAPMRERDLKALADLFVKVAIDEIEADITHHLLNRFPELCWEDDVFDFLQEYL